MLGAMLLVCFWCEGQCCWCVSDVRGNVVGVFLMLRAMLLVCF